MTELLIISLSGVAALVAEFLNLRKAILLLALLSFAAVFLLTGMQLGYTEDVFEMVSLDNFSRPFVMILCLLGIFWFWGFRSFFSSEKTGTDFFALSLFSFAGAICLVSYSNLVMLFLGIEILSIPVYVLAGSRKQDLAGNEAAFKYFLLGAMASAILLFGMALIYGSTGSFDMNKILSPEAMNSPNILLQTGLIISLAALSFKISAVPFHFWAPDVYQGSPTPVTAYMATIVKVASFAALLKFFQFFKPLMAEETISGLYIVIFLTLALSNLIGLAQTKAKRLLAYSSISHTGFMLMGIFGDADNLVYYSLVYGLSSLVAFRAFLLLGDENGTVSSFKGFMARNQLAAVSMILAMLSMAGIPPLSGFLAKYLMLATALSTGAAWLLVVGILASLMAIYYYFKIVIAMFQPAEAAGEQLVQRLPVADRVFFWVCSILLVGFGIYPFFLN